MNGRNLFRIQRLEKRERSRAPRVRLLWKDVLNQEAAAQTEAEAAKLIAEGFTVMVAQWTKPTA